MKAKHRHELKTNELAEWLSNLPQWTKDNLMMIIVVSVIAVAAIGALFYFKYQRKAGLDREREMLASLTTQLAQHKRDVLGQQTRGNDVSYLLVQLANRLENFAAGAKDKNSAAFAYIKHAEVLRADIHYRPVLVKRPDLIEKINRAKASYSKAFDLATTVSLKAAAKFGLGLCEEELGNFDEAGRIFSEILANADFEPTTAFVQAGQRLGMLDAYKQKVVFMAPPKTKTPSTIQPNMPRDPNIGSSLRPGQVGINRTLPKPAPTPAASELPGLVSPVDTNAAGDGSSGS